MTMELSGTAIVPEFYLGGFDNKKIIQIREEDIQSAIDNADTVIFVDAHEDYGSSSVKGIVTKMEIKDGAMLFNATICNESLEANIKYLAEQEKIPNVSVKMYPSFDSELTQHTDDKDNTYYTADSWVIEHISAVKNGRCSDSDGCGIHDYSIINSKPIGETMTDEMTELKKSLDGFMDTIGIVEREKNALSLELSGLKETNVTLVADMEKLKAETSDMKLELAAFEESKAKNTEKEVKEIKKGILVLDAEYEFSGEEAKKDLELVLNVLRRTDTRRGANVEGDEGEPSDSITAMREFKKAISGL